MLKEAMWGIFKSTGRIEAYVNYCQCLKKVANQ